MKAAFTCVAIAALLAGSTLTGRAEDAVAPTSPAAAQTAPPPSVPRPSIVSRAAEPASPPPTATSAAPRHRRYAHGHIRRYGYDRTAYWEPFPIYWPHIYHSRLRWNRIPWWFDF